MSSFAMTEKNPDVVDISITTIIDHNCAISGYFNPAACITEVNKCYNKASWPKTVQVGYKLEVINTCINKIIRSLNNN
jgi:hypothetical protein